MSLVFSDDVFMQLAVNQSLLSIPVDSAYCVGAVLVKNGNVIAMGFSRELPGNTHAEECCLLKVDNAKGCIMYTTMEPCSKRLSGMWVRKKKNKVGKKSCTELLIEHNISRVVIGAYEPSLFVQCEGTTLLSNAGIDVVHLPSWTDRCLSANNHLPHATSS